MKIIDCRNMACPAPVITTKRALEESGGDTIQIIVDPGAPRENVTRFAAGRGYTVQEATFEDGYVLTIGGTEQTPAKATPIEGPAKKTVFIVTSDRLGDGADDLGRLLMKNFIITLLDLERLPDRMLFLNSGVLLTTEGSEVLEALDDLGNRGVEILSCGVCLDFYHKKEQLKAGTVTNMFTIAESLMNAGSVIRL
ncbi:MAG: sulfurtransferase-like selenium metabolism protein YedF [Deltaproteobacteria bacterium]|nr:sulfurtransferase-like selenium metabolism protein YedF [Deltaproteobacteria bacterium]